MTNPTPPRSSIFRRLREPAALNYLVMAGAGFMVYGMIMVTRGNDAGAIIALLLAIAGILARWSAAPALILLLTTYLFIDPAFMSLIGWLSGNRWVVDFRPSAFDLEDLLLAAGILAYTVGHFRLTSIVHEGMPDEPTSQKERDPVNPPRRPVASIPPDELQQTLMVAAASVVVGQVGWWAMILIERMGRPSVFTSGTARLLIVIWITGLGLMLVSAVLVYLRGVRMSGQEAALLLRDEFFQENRRETDRLQRWRKWFKERVALRRRTGK